ncbi:NO-inducible flavohemoprotein [Metabacillus iocasae]|uniref:Flavohemoprotein n=1 Tax=Priestia iocasae TaxID=2291674 RepID=A0ABS2QXT9_9BACI|nr:NO-inducible flavohemoprotein [Metabacillus iocasae]MBM7704304.1 nitric oxide dioxygenase [Metabacillus iocasae]
MLSERTIQIVKSTAPVLQTYGKDITARFYETLFRDHPALLNIFNQTNQKAGRQPTALANTVYAAALHIDQLETLLPVVKQIGHKHRSIGVKAEHYPIVGEYLLRAIKDVLKDDATEDILQAWEEAYGVIASIFIQVEQDMYEEAQNQTGGWEGYRDFYVDKVVRETPEVTSFYVKPSDHQPLATFLPGQYVSVKLSVPHETYTHIRQYSLSDAPGKDYYRITVKRETGIEEGIVSTYLHDQVKEGDILPLSAPAGDFVYEANPEKPVVFISSGIGITPVVSMLKHLVHEHPSQKLTHIHAVRNSEHYALKREMNDLGQSVRLYVAYSQPTVSDYEQNDFQLEGRMNEDVLNQWIEDKDATYYVCGSESFMKSILSSLKALGVKEESVHYEFFGPKMSTV